MDFKVPHFDLPSFEVVKPVNTPAENTASEFYKKIVRMINNFDQSLDDSKEVGVRLVSYGQALTFHITDVSYENPSLIMFSGILDNGDPVHLVQHVTQISFLLTAMQRKEPEEPKRQIGFNTTTP
ncbi:hypothetical protein DC345_04960 [Paenibacillus taichungensis]|uniref:Uncharacterized protein n=1 Tax=Paenibacillus taichungensis TaxID=484184 RepID=A0A329R1S4_9BACL|nr:MULTISPECIES: DUF6173 family protein [Paenibacillus]RAW18481.1 hypothetical protein DC345_04960 [Paenibacillus taichungensis]